MGHSVQAQGVEEIHDMPHSKVESEQPVKQRRTKLDKYVWCALSVFFNR